MLGLWPASYKPVQSPLFRGHFSQNMHMTIPKFIMRIAQGMCFRKGMDSWFENARV